jgi:hypothetical protein
VALESPDFIYSYLPFPKGVGPSHPLVNSMVQGPGRKVGSEMRLWGQREGGLPTSTHASVLIFYILSDQLGF